MRMPVWRVKKPWSNELPSGANPTEVAITVTSTTRPDIRVPVSAITVTSITRPDVRVPVSIAAAASDPIPEVGVAIRSASIPASIARVMTIDKLFTLPIEAIYPTGSATPPLPYRID
jgi:hypothetical protein